MNAKETREVLAKHCVPTSSLVYVEKTQKLFEVGISSSERMLYFEAPGNSKINLRISYRNLKPLALSNILHKLRHYLKATTKFALSPSIRH